ncbi:hypothetical protein PFMG_03855 [Plasmodium falciparum IGH-CR14]|uniref:Uncharacterized protein n=1 Tax=Plasmodium falciparum IGH-CR14 TaxID=580059 RepID=A0A0L1IEP4_PLAFA|nr:hypothetical protein PFMG_03855 [Plasmodium falciparum IGH-CR14]
MENESQYKNINNVDKTIIPFQNTTFLNIIESVWNLLNVEKENSIDLFNEQIYTYLNKKAKVIFENKLLPHFITNAHNENILQNILFEKRINIRNKTHKNINELKRITNENDLNLLIRNNQGMHSKYHMDRKKCRDILLISKQAFFKIITNIVCNNKKVITSSNLYNNTIYKTLLYILKNTNNEINKKIYTYSFYEENGIIQKQTYMNKHQAKGILNTMHKNSTYENIEKSKHFIKNDYLLKEDYDHIKNSYTLNDIIHNSIIQLSKGKDLHYEHTREKNNKQIKDYLDKNNSIKYAKENNISGTQLYERRTLYKDPVYILKKFLERDRNILKYEDMWKDIAQYTFQPNIHKYIDIEYNQGIKKKENEKIKDKQLNLKNIFKNNEHIMHNNILTYMGNDEFSLLEKNEKKKISDEKYLELIYQFYGTHQANNNITMIRKKWDDESKPIHRISRYISRKNKILNNDVVKNNVLYNSPLGIPKEKFVNSLLSNCEKKKKWQNELRNGYHRNNFNFSLHDEQEIKKECDERKKRINSYDWNKQIRLYERGLKTKVTQNYELYNNIISTNMNNTNNYMPKNMNNTYNYMQKNMNNTNNYMTTNIHQYENNYKASNNTLQKKKNNNFDKINMCPLIISYNRSIPTPKVVTIKSTQDDILQNIKMEILSLPKSVQLL